jgi:hypothetical protein
MPQRGAGSRGKRHDGPCLDEVSPELAIAGVEVERAEIPELGDPAQLAVVEAERVESCSTGWSTTAQTGRGVLTVLSGSLSRLRSAAGER